MQDFLIITIHGINAENGEYSTDRFTPILKNKKIKTLEINYGDISGYQARFKNKEVIDTITEITLAQITNGVNKIAFIGHSNGCAVMHLASHELQKKLKNLNSAKYYFCYFYLNPCLEENLSPANIISETFVFYTYTDNVVYLGWLWHEITPDVFEQYRPWGKMGKVGYQGNKKTVHNIPYESIVIENKPLLNLGHSGIFRIKKFKLFVDYILAEMLREL